LRNLLLALSDLIAFAKENEIEGHWDFASVFIVLISSRPSVCAEALDRFADIRTLGIKTVYEAFQNCIRDSCAVDQGNCVSITLCGQFHHEQAILSLPILQAASVLLSIWKEPNGAASRKEPGTGAQNSGTKDEAGDASLCIKSLASMLLHPIDTNNDSIEKGLASAKMIQSGLSAVSVESVRLLQSSVCANVYVQPHPFFEVDHISESTERQHCQTSSIDGPNWISASIASMLRVT
jgi:hypothetical protein